MSKEKSGIETYKTPALIISTITIFTGLFGLSYQKGIILAMGLGNISGNYEVNEIFNSAISGYIEILIKIFNIQLLKLFQSALYSLIPPSVLVGFFILISLIIFRNSRKKKKIKLLRKFKINFLLCTRKSFISKLFLSAIGSVAAFLGFIIASSLVYAVLPSLAVLLLLPSWLGTLAGASHINQKLSEAPCVDGKKVIAKGEKVRQCTHLRIHEKTINGEIILENPDGYFIKINNGFLFAFKNKKGCIFSKYYQNNSDKKKDFPGFQDQQIDYFCGLNDNPWSINVK